MTREGENTIEIRMHPVLRFLGAALCIFVMTPSAICCVYFLLHPGQVVENPLCLMLFMASVIIFAWLTYRWLTIRGEIDSSDITLRGWYWTVRVKTADLAGIRTIRNLENDTLRYMLVDARAKRLGLIPGEMDWCCRWTAFLAALQELGRLQSIAHEERQ